MNWQIVAAFPLVLWAFYIVTGSLASKSLGGNATMLFESIAMIIVGAIAFLIGGREELQKTTMNSGSLAMIMGLCSAAGVLTQLYAFRLAPANQQGAVAMISGMFPILAVILFQIMFWTGINGGSPTSARQWLGIVCGGFALWLISGK